MKIFRCERCGKTYCKNADKWDDPLIFRVTWNYEDIDLCDACYVKLQKWVDDEQKENQEAENRYTPEEVILGKIRAEIERLDGKYLIGDYGIYGENIPKYVRLWDVLSIIDKYKVESEVKE